MERRKIALPTIPLAGVTTREVFGKAAGHPLAAMPLGSIDAREAVLWSRFTRVIAMAKRMAWGWRG